MKRGKKMILLLAVLAVMICGYFGVQGLNHKESVSETSGTFDLTTKKTDDLMGLSWTVGETTRSFKVSDGVWETMDEPSWPVKQETLQDLADQVVNLRATRKLEDVQSPADYGLENPVITVTAVWKNGTSAAYNMGDATPFEDGYYLNLSDQAGTVYTISSSLEEMFSLSQSEMTAMEEIPTVENPTRLKLGSSLNLKKANESRTVDPDQLWYDAETDEPVNGDEVESLISTISAIAWDELVSANADSASLESWMLNEEKAYTVTLTESGGISRTILLGASLEDSHYYARLPDSSMVYTVKSDDVVSLLNVTKDDLRISAILPMPYDMLDYAEFTTGKGTYRLQRQNQTQEVSENNENETEDDSESEEPVTAGESETETAQKALWNRITSLKAGTYPDITPDSEQVLSIHAFSQDGKESIVLFYEYNADSYLAVTDDGIPKTVPADEIDAIIREIRSLQ